MTYQGPPPRDEFLRDADGNLVKDRYGRPVRRTRPPRRQEPPRNQAQPRPQSQPRQQPQPPQYRQEQSAGRRYAQPQPQQFPRATQPRPQQHYAQPRPNPIPQPQYTAQPKPNAQPTPRKPRRQLRPGSIMRTLTLALVAILVLSVAGFFYLDTKLNRVQAMPATRVANTSGTNWLLVGSDSRAGFSEEDVARLGTGGDIGSTRTDTIMLLHIPLSGEATLLSVPRDSYVEIPGYGMDKINASFTYGGPPLLIETLEQATGLRVDRYAEIGMGGLANVVDAIGGIEICPAEAIYDDFAHIYVEPGCQKADGPTALGYVRTRATAQGDLDRVERQREFFASLVAKATKPSTLLNPFRVLPLASTAAASFTVNNKDHVWNLARIAWAMRGGITTETVPVGGFQDTEVGNVVIWGDEAWALFDSLR